MKSDVDENFVTVGTCIYAESICKMNFSNVSLPGNKPALGMERVSRKAGTPNPLSGVAKVEHAIVGQCLLEVIGPRLAQEVWVCVKVSHSTKTCSVLELCCSKGLIYTCILKY